MGKKNLAYYMNLPYKIEMEEQSKADGGGVFLTIPALGRYSVNAYGENYEEARKTLEEVKKDVLQRWLDEGLVIPEPETDEQEYSGKLLLRIPKFVHKSIAKLAKEQGISINSCINQLISAGLGQDKICKEISRQLDKLFDKFVSMEWPDRHIYHHLAPAKPQKAEFEKNLEDWKMKKVG